MLIELQLVDPHKVKLGWFPFGVSPFTCRWLYIANSHQLQRCRRLIVPCDGSHRSSSVKAPAIAEVQNGPQTQNLLITSVDTRQMWTLNQGSSWKNIRPFINRRNYTPTVVVSLTIQPQQQRLLGIESPPSLTPAGEPHMTESTVGSPVAIWTRS